MTNVVDASSGRLYSVVNVADNSTQVYAGKCKLWGVVVNTALSAHTLPIEDNGTTVITIAASAAAGTLIDCHGVTFATELTVNPNDAATGNVTVIYEPATDQ